MAKYSNCKNYLHNKPNPPRKTEENFLFEINFEEVQLVKLQAHCMNEPVNIKISFVFSCEQCCNMQLKVYLSFVPGIIGVVPSISTSSSL